MPYLEFLTFDAILLILLIVFIGWGFGNGFIKAVGGIVGIAVGVFVASRYFEWLSDIISPLFGPLQGLAKIVAFSFLFLLIGRLFGLVVQLVEKAYDVLAFLPFLKSINRLAGAIFGFMLGVLILGTILYVIGKYSRWTAFNDAAAASDLAQYLISTSSILRPLFPSAIRELQSYF